MNNKDIKPIELSVIEFNKNGLSIKDIANAVGVSRSYISKILKINNLKPNVKPKFGTYAMKCNICKKDFIPKSRNAVTCNKECKNKLSSIKTTLHALKSGAKNVITQEKQDIILYMRGDGHSISDISSSLDLDAKAVRQFISRKTELSTLHGNEKYNKRMSEDDKATILHMNSSGLHVKSIAEKTNYSVTSIKDFLYKNQTKPNLIENSEKFNRRFDSSIIDSIINLHSLGLISKEIASKTGFSATAIRRFLKTNNLKPNYYNPDRSRPCAICKKVFTPLWNDGIKKTHVKACSAVCSGELRSKNKIKYGQEEIDLVIKMVKEGYSNETISHNTRVKISKVKEIVASYNLYRSGNPGSSALENEVSMWVGSLGLPVEKYKFDSMKEGGKEIDIITTPKGSDRQLGIEMCGLFWHSEQTRLDKARGMHLQKLKKANNEGIELITLFSDEWVERNKQVKSFLRSKLNKNENTVYARKTEIRQVEKNEAKVFLESYHIQGNTNFDVAFGLYHKDELVSVVTGSKHHRQGHEDVLVLSRLCFKENTNVTGGSSRLFRKLVEYAKNNSYSKIISWSDNRWSEGKVYKALGFVLEKELEQDYSYVYGNKRFSKQGFKKVSLIKRGAIGATEKEMAISLGFYRIWDCGKKRWVFNLL